MSTLPPIPKAVRLYIEGGASEGKRNETLFHAVCQCRDAGWPDATIYDILGRRGMLDGLTEDEAQKTIGSALSRSARPPAVPPNGAKAKELPKMKSAPKPKVIEADHSGNVMKAVRYILDESEDLPKPMENPTETIFRHLFKLSERVQVVVAKIGEDGKEKPVGSHPILNVETWLEKIEEKGGISELFSTHNEEGKVNEGLYFSINPIQDAMGGRKAKNMARMDYALIEFDTISLKQQWQLIKQSKIPCAAVTYSGGKSIHAIVRVNARSDEEYKWRIRALMDHFSEYDVDTANKDPSRLSRLPGVTRGDTGKEQTLLALDLGYPNWQEWEDSQVDAFPDIVACDTFYEEDIPMPHPIIDGLLNRQMSFSLGGASKTFKSWTLLDMAVSVANGVPFWGLETHQGKVLYINFEIQKYFMRERVKRVEAAKGINFPTKDLYLWNLRGEAQALEAIKPKFIKAMVNRNFSMVILDPIYKTLGDRDENAAGDINSLMNELESIALDTGAATVFATHFSKGNQATKKSLDRNSGSGVFSRAPDTIMTLTEHQDPDCFTVESTVRNHETPKSFVVKMDFPLFKRRDDKNPSKLAAPTTARQKETTDNLNTIVQLLDIKICKPMKDVLSEAKECGISETVAKRTIQKGVTEKRIIKTKAETGRGFVLRRNPVRQIDN